MSKKQAFQMAGLITGEWLKNYGKDYWYLAPEDLSQHAVNIFLNAMREYEAEYGKGTRSVRIPASDAPLEGGGGDKACALPASWAACMACLDDEGRLGAALKACVTEVVQGHIDAIASHALRIATGVSHEGAVTLPAKIDKGALAAVDVLRFELLHLFQQCVPLHLRRLEAFHHLKAGSLGLKEPLP